MNTLHIFRQKSATRFVAFVTLFSLLASAFPASFFVAFADSVGTITFESGYTLGSVHTQDGWLSSGPYDQGVADVSALALSQLGTKAFRISNAVTTGAFGDQTFVKPLTDSVGEVDATNGTFSPGSKKNTFEIEFDFTSASPSAQQPGLFISMSPDRGDGSRMSYLSFEDKTDGIQVNFVDVQGTSPANFVTTPIGLYNRGEVNTAKLVMTVVDGPSNDIVKVYINDVLEHTGTSWENYFRFSPESVAEQSPRIVKTAIFRAGGTAAPANDDKGFLFDNISLESSDVVAPPKTSTTVEVNPSNLQGFTVEASGGGQTQFVADVATPLGNGHLKLLSDDSVTARAGVSKSVDVPLSTLDGLSYKTKQNEANVEAGNAAYRLRFDADGDIATTNDVATLIYEPYWQNGSIASPNPDTAPVLPDVWQTWDVDNGFFWVSVPGSSAAFFSPNGITNGAGGPPFFTLGQIEAFYPNAKVTLFSVNIGSYNPLYDIDVDAVVFGTDTAETLYDFEPAPKAPICKNGKNLLENASFETPEPDANTDYGGMWEIFSAVTGWVISGDGLEIWNGLFGGSSDGDQNAELDGTQPTNISQLVTTIPGATYELKFDFSARPGTNLADNSITAKADGTDVVTAAADGTSLSTNSWSTFSGTFVAGDNQTEVKFVDNGTNNGLGSLIDNTALCLVSEPEPVAVVSATKIVCEDESLLPNDGYTTIASTTAAEFLASTPERTAGCSLVPDWKFQWAINGQDVLVDNQGEQGSPWVTTENTNASGLVEIKIPQSELGSGKTISVREVMKEGFLPFTGRNTDQTVSAELYCTSDAANYDNLEWIPNVTAGNTYHCVAWNVELPPPAADVTMCKFDEEGTGLNGWQLSLLGNKVETLTIPANLPSGVNTVNSLTQGTSYVAVAQGTWDNNRGPLNIVDAEYSTENGWMTVMDGFTGYGTDILELQLNSTFDPNSNWGTYNSLHRYARGFIPATTGTQNFRIYDTFHGDNAGNLSVDIYEGYTGITSNNGCVTFKDVPFGTYNADEILKDGWQVVSGVGEVKVDAELETFNIVNRDISEVPMATIVAEKIVCETEADLPNWNTTGIGPAPKITATTAADWVAQSDGACQLVPDWQFEWASENIADPSDTVIGTAGAGWNTFGPTNTAGKATIMLDAEDIDGDSFIWVREVLKDGYIPFTHQATSDNSNNVTAEMYCHTDGLNYDNWDRVDGIDVDKTYHCVAFNARTPKPAPKCELEVVSSTNTLVVDTNDFAVATDDNNEAWTADIAEAVWVWATEFVQNPTQQEVYTFEETFTVDNPTSALLDIAADNTFKVFINGEEVEEIDGSNENNFADHTQKNDRDVLSYLNDTGENTIRIEVTNLAQNGGNSQSNPAGVLFRLDIVGESDCEITTEPMVPADNSYRLDGYKYQVIGEVSTPKAGWTIYAENTADDSNEVLSTTTDSTGYYYFDVEGISGDNWKVYEAMQLGWEQVRVEENDWIVEPGEGGIAQCNFEVYEEYEGDYSRERLYKYEEAEYKCDFYNKLTEVPPTITTDDGDNSSGTRTGSRRAPARGSVLGASTMQCGMLISDYMRMGQDNDPFEVKKLQWFLISQGYFEVTASGVFDSATEKAVEDFQEKYRSEILTPWVTAGILTVSNPTGWVYQLTRWKINNIICPGSELYPTLIP